MCSSDLTLPLRSRAHLRDYGSHEHPMLRHRSQRRRLGLDRPVPAGSPVGWADTHDRPARRPTRQNLTGVRTFQTPSKAAWLRREAAGEVTAHHPTLRIRDQPSALRGRSSESISGRALCVRTLSENGKAAIRNEMLSTLDYHVPSLTKMFRGRQRGDGGSMVLQ